MHRYFLKTPPTRGSQSRRAGPARLLPENHVGSVYNVDSAPAGVGTAPEESPRFSLLGGPRFEPEDCSFPFAVASISAL